MTRICALLLVIASAATAAPAYPIHHPKLTQAALAKREAEFRARNPEPWTAVDVDSRGFINHVALAEPAGPAWTDAEVAWVRDLLKKNADLFGIEPADADRLTTTNLLVTDVIGGAAILDEINVHHYNDGHGGVLLDITMMYSVGKLTATVSPDDVAKRVIGQHYSVTFGFGAPPHLDCAMTSAGAAGCKSPAQHTKRAEVTPTKAQVTTVTWLHADGDDIRLVTCADVESLDLVAPNPAWHLAVVSRLLVPRGSAPSLPLVVDAVTGKILPINVETCYDPKLSNARS